MTHLGSVKLVGPLSELSRSSADLFLGHTHHHMRHLRIEAGSQFPGTGVCQVRQVSHVFPWGLDGLDHEECHEPASSAHSHAQHRLVTRLLGYP